MALQTSSRLSYIDWMRGLAVVIMVGWHTLDAWTTPVDKASGAFWYCQLIGGFGAPIFLTADVADWPQLFYARLGFEAAATREGTLLHALMEHDLKRLLAYHTVENIGIIFIGLGLALAFRANSMNVAAALALDQPGAGQARHLVGDEGEAPPALLHPALEGGLVGGQRLERRGELDRFLGRVVVRRDAGAGEDGHVGDRAGDPDELPLDRLAG